MIYAVVGLAFWIAETWYFGWNKFPESHIEAGCDVIATALMSYGLGWMARARALERELGRQVYEAIVRVRKP